MTFEGLCPHCGAAFDADWQLRGCRSECPGCAAEIQLPNPPIGAGVTIGDFEIVEKLGEGGMGQVFLAEQRGLGRKVALKVLPPEVARHPARLKRFEKEVRTQAQVEHPNIATAFHAGEDDGTHYLAMSYVPGASYAEVIEDEGPLSEAAVLRLLAEASGALLFAWDEHQLIHRDIKPANLMRDDRQALRLVDFGLGTSLADRGTIGDRGLLESEIEKRLARPLASKICMDPPIFRGKAFFEHERRWPCRSGQGSRIDGPSFNA